MQLEILGSRRIASYMPKYLTSMLDGVMLSCLFGATEQSRSLKLPQWAWQFPLLGQLSSPFMQVGRSLHVRGGDRKKWWRISPRAKDNNSPDSGPGGGKRKRQDLHVLLFGSGTVTSTRYIIVELVLEMLSSISVFGVRQGRQSYGVLLRD